MTRIAGAIVAMVLSRQLMIVLSGVGMVVLARLLTPDDFGIYATVLATFLLLELVIRFGLPEYLISAPRVSTGMLRSALGLTLAIGAGIVALALLFLLTPASAWLAPELRLALLVMLPGLAAVPVSAVPEATLRRRLAFGTFSWLGVGSTAADVTVSIALALAGAGPLAMVGGLVASRLCTAAVLLWVTPRLLRPRFGGWRRFFPYTPHMTGSTLLPKAADLGAVLIVPSFLGLAALGLYNRAQTVVGLLDRVLLDGVTPVMLPALSERLRTGAPVEEVYGAKTARLTVLVWPVFAVIAVLAEPVVLVLLGAQWTSAVPVVQILCAVGLAVPFTSMSMQFFAATGQIDAFLRIQAANQVVRLGLVALGALHSLEGVACAVVLARLFKAVHVRRALERIIGPHGGAQRRRDYAGAALVTLLAMAGPVLLVVLLPEISAVVLLGAGVLAAALGWLTGVLLVRHPLVGDLRALPLVQRAGLGRPSRLAS